MTHQETTPQPLHHAEGERGAALIMALLVSLVLVFLGMGLLLQTSLGLQASGTDRWVTKAMYAADAGAMMQIEMIQMGAIGPPGTFILEDDPDLPGLLKGQFTVTVSGFCETQPPTPVFVNGVSYQWPDFKTRHFHLRSDAQRAIGGLEGMSRAAVEVEVTSYPFSEAEFVPLQQCY